jgi:Na+/H+-dicarboxylate symporter
MKRRLPSQSAQVLVALVLGLVIGWLFPGVGGKLEFLSQIFLRMILMIVGPLVFFTLVVGIAESSAGPELGSLALHAGLYFLLITGLALILGLVTAIVLKPGNGAPAFGALPGVSTASPPVQSEPFYVRLIPANIVDPIVHSNVLQIVFFSVLFALALRTAGSRGEPVIVFCRGLATVVLRLTGYVMMLAPAGVLGAAASAVGKHGIGVLGSFVKLLLAVGVGLAILSVCVFPLLAALRGVRLAKLFRAAKEALLISFATASSAAALPNAVSSLEETGLPLKVVSFVLSTGLTFNLSGTTLFIGVASLFVLQVSHIALTSGQLVELFLTMFLLSKGVPAVPRGSLLLIAAGLESAGYPRVAISQGIGLLLAIDPILDMARTATNMAGNCLVAGLVAADLKPTRSDSEFERECSV